MNWETVGDWLKDNAGTGAALVGSLLTGNVPGAVAAGVALVSSATGTTDPKKALVQLQSDPATVIRLRELAMQDEQSIRDHLRAITALQLDDEQKAHKEQQETIRQGDNASDEYVRRTRPMMARQSWFGTMGYVISFEAAKAVKLFNFGASTELALILIGPAAAYMGFRAWEKVKGVTKS